MNTERKIIFLAFSMILLHLVDFMLIGPLSPYFERQLSISVSLIGAITGIYTLASAFSSLLFSRFIDRIKRKPAIIVALTGLAITTALTAISWNASSLLAFRFLAGLFGGPVSTLAFTLITDNVPFERRGRAMGIIISAFSVSSAVALPLAILVATHLFWRLPFVLVGLLIITLVFITLSYSSFTQTLHKQTTGNYSFLKTKVVWFAFFSTCISTGTLFALVPNFANFFVMNRHVEISHLSFMYLCGGATSIIFANIAGKLTDKFGSIPICIFALTIGASALLLGIIYTIIPVALFFALVMGAGTMRRTSLTTQISQVPLPHQRGSFNSLLSAMTNFAMALGASSSGLFLTKSIDGKLVGMSNLAIVAIATSFFVPILMLFTARLLRQREQLCNT